MQTFQVERKPRETACERIKAQGRKLHGGRNRKIARCKNETKKHIETRAHPLHAKRKAQERDKIVRRAARNAHENTDKKGIKLRH